MSYANVAHSGTLTTSSGAALSWTHSPSANNLLSYRAGSYSTEIGATAVTTSGGAGTFNRDVGAQKSPDGEWSHIFSLVAPSGVTSMAMAAGPTYVTARFDEWSGDPTTGDLDATTSATGNGTSGNSGTWTPGASAGLLLAAINIDYANSGAPTGTGSGWTTDVAVGDTTGVSSGFASKIGSVGGVSQEMTWTLPTAGDWAGVSASYNAAGGSTLYTRSIAWSTTYSETIGRQLLAFRALSWSLALTWGLAYIAHLARALAWSTTYAQVVSVLRIVPKSIAISSAWAWLLTGQFFAQRAFACSTTYSQVVSAMRTAPKSIYTSVAFAWSVTGRLLALRTLVWSTAFVYALTRLRNVPVPLAFSTAVTWTLTRGYLAARTLNPSVGFSIVFSYAGQAMPPSPLGGDFGLFIVAGTLGTAIPPTHSYGFLPAWMAQQAQRGLYA